MAFPCRLFLLALSSSAIACSTSNGGVGDGGIDARAISDVGAGDATRHEAGKPVDGGTPSLTELSVTGPASGDASAPITLIPAFSPSIVDYYVRCAEGTNLLTVTMTASRGASALVIAPVPSPSLPKQTLLMGVGENQEIEVAATDGTATREYWVRCLPHDFPHLQMTTPAGAAAPPAGYYLVGNQTAQTGEGYYAMILDVRGVPVWYQSVTTGKPVYNVDSLDAGVISFGTPYEVRQLDPPTLSYVTFDGYATDTHEMRALPNGDYLVLWEVLQTGVDLTGLSLPLADGGTQVFGPDASISACDIVEVNPAGGLVWAWAATDHFDAVKDTVFTELAPLVGPEGGPVADPFHCNAIDVDGLGNFLVSARHMDSIFYIDRASGAVLWKMGGKTFSKDPTIYVPVPDAFHRQHDARLQPDWKATCEGVRGHISMFDDETNVDASARAVVYDVRIGLGGGDGGAEPDCGPPPDGGVTGAAVSWQYAGDASVFGTGSFRILPDGSRVIGWGSDTTRAFTEVDEAKHVLLEFSFTDGNTTYRAIKVPLSQFSLDVLRATAGQ